MSPVLAVFIVLAGLYVGGNIGANDAANCIGASVGARLVRYRTGILLVAIFAVAGALIQGNAVAKTVGKGLVTDPLPDVGVMAALLCGGLFVTVATFFRIPVSTSQSIVGAVAGIGLAADLHMEPGKIAKVCGSWVICPILCMILCYGLYRGILWWLPRIKDQRRARVVLRWLVLVSAAYASYSLGANNLGNAIGPIAALDAELLDPLWLAVLGAASIAAGALIFGRGVVETVGSSIIPLDLPSAFSVQVAGGFGLHLFSMLGVPVSTSQSIVGALLGIGLYQGIKTVSRRKMLEVVIGWIATPTCAGLVSFLIYRLIIAVQG